MKKLLLSCLLLGLAAGVLPAQPQAPVIPADPSYEVKELPCTNSLGKRLYGELVTPRGGEARKPVIIMVHGFNGTHINFYDIIPEMAKDGFICYTFDLMGGSSRSRSEGSTSDMTIFTETQDIIDVVEMFRGMQGVDPGRIFLLGESQGGLVSAMAAARIPDKIKALGLMYPALGIPASAERIYPDRVVPDVIDVMGMKLGGDFYRKIFDYDVFQEIGNYKGPVIDIHGDADRLVDKSLSERAASIYQNCEFHIIEGGDHGFNDPEHRAICRAFLRKFFNDQNRAAGAQNGRPAQAGAGAGRGFPMMGRQPVRHSIILPDLLQGEIVLQQQTDARIWGKTEPGMEVTVHTPWNDCNYRAKAGADSLWSVKVATPSASYTPYDITISNARETLVLYDVLVGDVWFCGGQSNMQMPVKGMFNCAVDGAAEAIMHSARNKGLRYVTVAQHQATESDPRYFTEGRWTHSGPATAGDFSATGFFFGQALWETLDYPIGLISCNWSGSFVEDWVDKDFIAKYPNQEVFGAEFSKAFTKMYYGMLEPASKYTIKGMIWYQGESNVGSPDYAERLVAAVDLWKSKFELATLPFYIVEIAPYNYNKGFDMLSADLRGQQLKAAQQLPESGLVCTNDLVYDYEGDQIHPAQKKAVGERLAMLALSKTYRMNNPCEGPLFREMIIDGGAASILFDNAANGFVSTDDIRGFEIAGADGVFYPARATVGFAPRRPAPAAMPAPGPDGQRPRGGSGMFGGGFAIRVSSDKVPEPVAVRYGYGPFKPGNLHNTEGLPAYPFRTDSWPLK